MTTSIKQFIVILSSIFILGTVTGISTQAYADQKPDQHKVRKDQKPGQHKVRKDQNPGQHKVRKDQKPGQHKVRKDQKPDQHKVRKDHQRPAHSGNRYDNYRKDHHRPAQHGRIYDDRRHSRPTVIHHGPGRHVPAQRWYRYRNVHVVRHYGPMYRGYGHYFLDSDAYPWLAFTAITLKVLDNVNESQQRAHESAQVRAASAPIGESITWNDGQASGSVTPVRDGTSTSGRYCREFQHQVTVGGKKGQAYGTACRQPDGSWEVISSGAP